MDLTFDFFDFHLIAPPELQLILLPDFPLELLPLRCLKPESDARP
jgi:hypothetical protein